MCDLEIFKNSYVMFFISAIVLFAGFYFFYHEKKLVNVPLQNGNFQQKYTYTFNWKYPLAISLLIWIIWHFYLFPPPVETMPNHASIAHKHSLYGQQICMDNWY